MLASRARRYEGKTRGEEVAEKMKDDLGYKIWKT